MSKAETSTPEPAEKPSGKKPYNKPCTLSTEPLEAMAVVCSGPTAKATPFGCNLGPISS
ncbi:hypothetical protein [Thiolapillus sp.]